METAYSNYIHLLLEPTDIIIAGNSKRFTPVKTKIDVWYSGLTPDEIKRFIAQENETDAEWEKRENDYLKQFGL